MLEDGRKAEEGKKHIKAIKLEVNIMNEEAFEKFCK